MERSVAIIGAGIAGISTLKIFKEYGFDCTTFEKDVEVGGVWASSRRYSGLETQNPKREYSFSDYEMPKDYPKWPSGEQVQKYLDAYMEFFDLKKDILFNTEVISTQYDKKKKRWQVTYKKRTETETDSDGGGAAQNEDWQQQMKTFDLLIVCNGIFSEPKIPDFKGDGAFTAADGNGNDGNGNAGRHICHTSQYTNLDDAKDKDIVVVGYGKSACNFAVAAQKVALSVTVVTCQLL